MEFSWFTDDGLAITLVVFEYALERKGEIDRPPNNFGYAENSGGRCGFPPFSPPFRCAVGRSRRFSQESVFGILQVKSVTAVEDRAQGDFGTGPRPTARTVPCQATVFSVGPLCWAAGFPGFAGLTGMRIASGATAATKQPIAVIQNAS